MSVEQIEKTLLELPREERRRFAEWFYDHEEQLLGADSGVVDESWRTEIRKRLTELEKGEVSGVPGEEVSAKIRKIVGQ